MKNNGSRDEIYEETSRIHLHRLYKNTKITNEPNITPVLNKIQE
jgi:hypothetical protein